MSYYSKTTHKPAFKINWGFLALAFAGSIFAFIIGKHLYDHTVMETVNHAPTYTTEMEECIYDIYTELEYVYGINPLNKNKMEYHWENVTKYVYGEHEVRYQHWMATLTLRNGEVVNDYRKAEVNSTVCLYKG